MQATDENATQTLMVPNETYVLTKRFTSKEERRRVVAVVSDPSRLPAGIAQLGIENHVNYFHASGRGLAKVVARGLALARLCNGREFFTGRSD